MKSKHDEILKNILRNVFFLTATKLFLGSLRASRAIKNHKSRIFGGSDATNVSIINGIYDQIKSDICSNFRTALYLSSIDGQRNTKRPIMTKKGDFHAKIHLSPVTFMMCEQNRDV